MSSFLEIFSNHLGSAIAYYPRLAKVAGSAIAAIFLGYLVRQEAAQNSDSAWIEREAKEIEAATGLSEREQTQARKQLRDRGFLRERQGTTPTTLAFSVDRALVLEKLQVFARLVFTQELDDEPPEKAPDPFFPVRRPQNSVEVTPNYQFQGPWESTAQFQAFQTALLEYATARQLQSPGGWTFKIIDGITKGLLSPYWQEFIAGVPLGSTQHPQRDWEVEPGVPYPAFEEERIQYYIHKGEPLDAAVARARRDLRNPTVAQDLWDGFLRRCDRLADEALKAKKLGVKSPYLPPSFTDKVQIRKETVVEKLSALASPPTLPDAEARSPEGGDDPPQENTREDSPKLEILQEIYSSSLGKTLVEKQIAAHPEWGYGIVEGRVVDLYPF